VRQPLRLVSVALVAAALLTGCDGPPPTAPPTTAPAAPRFASDEEALAAAEEAYGAYMAVSDQVIRDGGVDDERLRPFLSREIYAFESSALERLRANRWHGVGYSLFELTLQSHDAISLIAYVCFDVSQTDLVDATGASVVEPDRRIRVPFEMEFDVNDAFRIVRRDEWEGSGVC
jgi:hypothetical protein